MRALAGSHVVVLGAAGFLGSHLCDRLVAAGARVSALDNFLTSTGDNLAGLLGEEAFTLQRYDVTNHLHVAGEVDAVLHFASPASPADYLRWPIQTLKVGSLGTHKALGLARAKRARFLLASTSEVYGSPQVSPQPEDYWGHVNPIGPRGVYDEAKRFAEALALAYHREHGLEVRIARIFNTYGPRMRLADGRAVPAFFAAALRGEPLPVHGDGTQTRSLCSIDDLVDGLLALLASDENRPVNLGNPDEVTMNALAGLVQDVVGRHPGLTHLPRPVDDPPTRCPDLSRAREVLGWQPRIDLRDGLERTLPWFVANLDPDGAESP